MFMLRCLKWWILRHLIHIFVSYGMSQASEELFSRQKDNRTKAKAEMCLYYVLIKMFEGRLEST